MTKYGKKLTPEQVRSHAKKHGFKNPLESGLSEPKLEQNAQNALDGAAKGSRAGEDRIRVSIKGYRVRTLDPDGFSGSCKFIIDQLSRQGYIPDDSLKFIILETSQNQVDHFSQEKTLITLIYP